MFIARDRNGMLYLYRKAPTRNEDGDWRSIDGSFSRIDEDLLEDIEVSWKDEPVEVDVIIKRAVPAVLHDNKRYVVKRFDFEEAKKGAKVCTASGLDVKILSFECNNPTTPIVALVKNSQGIEYVFSYTKEGILSFMAPNTIASLELMIIIEEKDGEV